MGGGYHSVGMGTQTGTRTLREVRNERLRIRQWRRAQFYRLGFTTSDARTLAKSDADVGEARRLVMAGCPTATAYRIVR